ncbi:MAG TPA: lytic transglycosylase domain-containing protein [Thermodesulfovibrionales bacterium]|nr:lytic transglycosylase domain-containing protein [Thermodesulfovibrionales bacterium]
MRLFLAACVMTLLFVSVSHADIYRTVDKNGVVCYTDISFNKSDERVIKSQDASPALREEGKEGLKKKEFHGIVKEKAAKYAMDPSLIHAVIKAESNGNPYALSRKGAKGLMQLMPTTANDLQVRDPFDPEENIDGGTRYLKYLIEKFGGDLTLALAAYNAGPRTVEKSGSVPRISETRQYIRRVLSLYGGKTSYSLSPSSLAASPKERRETIYKVLNEDGTILFTNSPLSLSRKNPRF